MKIHITGIKEVISRLDQLGVRARFAAAKALNETAYSVMTEERKEIADSFDRPVPIVQKSVLFKKANPDELTASIYIPGEESTTFNISSVLSPHIKGGGRISKASEKMLRRAGVLGNDQYVVPGSGVALDQYGNIPGPAMVKILSAAGLFGETGYVMNQTARSRKRNKGAMRGVYCIPFVGIFQHTASTGSGNRRWATKYGGAGTPLILFVRRPRYEAGRFDFYGTAKQAIKTHLPAKLRAALKVELK